MCNAPGVGSSSWLPLLAFGQIKCKLLQIRSHSHIIRLTLAFQLAFEELIGGRGLCTFSKTLPHASCPQKQWLKYYSRQRFQCHHLTTWCCASVSSMAFLLNAYPVMAVYSKCTAHQNPNEWYKTCRIWGVVGYFLRVLSGLQSQAFTRGRNFRKPTRSSLNTGIISCFSANSRPGADLHMGQSTSDL